MRYQREKNRKKDHYKTKTNYYAEPEDSNDYFEEEFSEPHKNVLLLNMSIIKERAIYKYSYRNGFICDAVCPLEPISKYVLYKLNSIGEKLDRIIIVASQEACDNNNQPWDGKSSVDVYLDRMNEYVTGNTCVDYSNNCKYYEENKIDDKNIRDGFRNKYINGLKENAPASDGAISYCVVRISDNDSVDDFIRLKKAIISDDKNINLYFDTQGGGRNWVLQINTIMEMLKADNAKICGRYLVKFNPNKKFDFHNIENADVFYNTDLLMAYTNFKKYGIGDDLFKYLDEYEEIRSGALSRVVRAMKDATDAIRLCDTDTLNLKLKEIDRLSIEAQISTDSRIQLIYSDLLNECLGLDGQDDITRFLNQIEWCIKKKMLVQALSLVESQYLDIIYKLGIYSLSWSDKDACLEIAKASILGKADFNKSRYYHDGGEMLLSVFTIREHFFQNARFVTMDGLRFIDRDSILNLFKQTRETFSVGEISIKEQTSDKKLMAPYSLKLSDKNIPSLQVINYLYVLIKYLRNGIVHADRQNFKYRDLINNALILLLEETRKLYKDLQ